MRCRAVRRFDSVYRETVLRDVPISYLPLEETSGHLALDLSVEPYVNNFIMPDVALNSGTPAIDQGRRSMRFNRALFSYITNLLGGMNVGFSASIEAWVRMSDNFDFEVAVGLGDTIYANGGSVLYARYSGGPCAFQIACTNGWVTLFGPTLQLNTWHHLVATYDYTDAWFYVNGSLCNTQPLNNYLVCPILGTNIGTLSSPNQNSAFCGNIQHVAFYTFHLSEAAIRRHYRAGLGKL